MIIQKIQSKIIEISPLAKDTKKFILSVPKNFRFKAGQYILLELPLHDTIQRRAYSIASTLENKRQIELCIKKIAKKGFVSELFKLKTNSKITFLGPIGKFFIEKRPKNKIVFISVGTGIAPLRSMIEYLLKNLKFKKAIILIHGYRHEENIFYEKIFSNLEKKFSNFKQYIVLSKPKKIKEILKGHVQNHISKIISKPQDCIYYICGMKEMISEVTEKLNKLKIKKQNIFFEKYN